MRGKVPPPRYSGTCTGITPACAGKSAAAQIFRHLYWDHPRMCGEKRKMELVFLRQTGSPPHVRGKDHVAHPCERFVGITPACAGKSVALDLNAPQMRGKVQQSLKAAASHGITPACAGKSQHFRRPLLRLRDHPRMCGEKWMKSCRATRSTGSPPHVRGKAHDLVWLGANGRITPACAGKRNR